ncbi:MAG TPA: hypothetical protein PLA68_18360, partial [Panacibacter sp.]|nr:hypothetical protein [Panacibacter sp.]
DEEPTNPITVSSTGLVSAKALGGAYINVTANGIMGQAEVVVNPDTVILVTPFYTMLGTDFLASPPVQKTTEVFTATTYKVDRTAYRNKSGNYLNTIPNPANLQWDLPLTGVPEIDNLFNIVTLSNKSNTSCKVTAIPNKIGSTFIVAHDGANGGAASIISNP